MRITNDPGCLVYIAAPFTARNTDGTSNRVAVARNVREAEKIGVLVAELGLMPIIPTAATQYGPFESAQNAEFWYCGTAELLGRCDVLLLHPEWWRSSGCQHELSLAARRKMPIFGAERLGEAEFKLPPLFLRFATARIEMRQNCLEVLG